SEFMAERAPEAPEGAGEVGLEQWLETSLERINREARLHFHPEFLFRLWNTCVEHWHDRHQRSLDYAKYRYLLLMHKAMYTHMQQGCPCRNGRLEHHHHHH
uniref:Vpx protein n=1 Tax=Simian immunodeficiency virus TaxID=11723 RepID=UPI0006454574|nr:Chain B, Vpx protein [Simian immunodeficiency virus]4Z8L_E Chain E, Vpx protein [Simian immunodeficiency virus]